VGCRPHACRQNCRNNPKTTKYYILNKDPDAFYFAEKVAGILNIFSHNKVNSFVEAACWPDDIKKFGLENLDDWHFIDIPIYVNNTKFQNITHTINDAIGLLVIYL
jgi:hypothetical protein